MYGRGDPRGRPGHGRSRSHTMSWLTHPWIVGATLAVSLAHKEVCYGHTTSFTVCRFRSTHYG
jgi:hypothetical protein